LGVKVVWNIRLKGDIFCLLADAWIFPHYINAIAGRGWVEQLRSDKRWLRPGWRKSVEPGSRPNGADTAIRTRSEY
jgi:hypothetical protein